MLSTVFFFLLHLDVGGGKKAGMRHYKGKHHCNCLSVWNDIMRYIISFNATLPRLTRLQTNTGLMKTS